MPETNSTNNNLCGGAPITLLPTQSIAEFVPNADKWQLWHERFEIYLCEIDCTNDNVKKSILLKSIGAEAYGVLHSLCSPQSPVSKSYKDLCEILKTHFTPPTIIFQERKNFHNAVMGENETVSNWFARIKKLALNCKFGEHLDAFILDKFIMGLPSRIFERICEDDERLCITDAFKKALILETKFKSSNKMSERDDINFVKRNTWKNNNMDQKRGNKSSTDSRGSNNSSGSSSGRNCNNSRNKKECSHCGWRNHKSFDCKFKESKCHSCSKVGHLASVCRSRNNVNYVSEDSNFSQFDDSYNFSIFSIESGSPMSLYTLPIMINGFQLEAICDTGASCTLLPRCFLHKINVKEKDIRSCKTSYISYSGNSISIFGEFLANITYNGITKTIIVVVTNTENPPLLGRTFLRAFNFELKRVNTIVDKRELGERSDEIRKEFADVFDGSLGAYKYAKISLSMNEMAKPIFFKPRPLPFTWKSQIEEQLRDLIKNDILEPVDQSEWGTPIVPILKPDGSFRLCGDFKVTINKHLVDFTYPLPRIDEVFAALQGGCLFTKLDLSNAYNQLLLDESSQLLCTLSTHIGTLKMKRLPFGIKTAAAIFQKTIEGVLSGIPGVVVYQDDITVTGKTVEEHMSNLRLVLNKLRDAGLKLNLRKCKFFEQKISYLGFTIDKDGLSKNEDRIASIVEAPPPQNMSQLRAVIGMLNYYSKFINDFAKKMVPLYNLLKKDVKFYWSKQCQTSYEILKNDIVSDQVLVHFNPDFPIVLTTDACNTAVAGVLSHVFPDKTMKPIAFVSRALTKTEMNYSTLEKEALAIIFCVTKLRQYLLGNHFTLRTDHKPLLTIFGEKKGLPLMASARVQRWALILSGFDYSVDHVKGTLNHADNLSRMPQVTTVEDYNECNYINLVERENLFDLNFKSVARETRRDPVLSKVASTISKGMVHQLKGDDFKSYREKANELSIEYDCVLWGYRIVIPSKLRKSILESLHSSHFGIVKTKALARSYVWWPAIDKDIEILIKNCRPCQELQSSPEKSVLIPWNPAESVWSRIHIDFAGPIKNRYLLIVIDSFSKWVEVFTTREITSHFTINKLRELFSRFGIVDTIVSDNGRQFVSDEFETFLRLNNIKHILTAPGHPSTNGQAENFVKTVKKSVLANLKEKNNAELDILINRFLIDYRNTPHCSTGESPAKLLLGRSLKTRFDHLRPPLTKKKIKESQEKSVLLHKGKRNLQFSEGEKVLIRNYKDCNKPSWSPATIKQKIGEQSYLCIMSESNREIKRHLDQMRSLNCNESQNTSDSSNDREGNLLSGTGNEGNSEANTSASNIKNENEGAVCEGTSNRNLRPRKDGRVVRSNEVLRN